MSELTPSQFIPSGEVDDAYDEKVQVIASALAYLKDIDEAQCSGEVWDAICNAVEMLE